MNKEIKEILDYYQKDIDRYEKNMKNYTEYQQKTTFSKNYQRYKNHKLLLDYITNLQETKDNMEQELQELYLIKDNLQEENKRLHTRIKTIKRRRKAQTAKMRKYREEITNKQNSIVDYKSRNEKAIEKLERIRTFGLRSGKTLFSTLINETIDILQGSDKDD